MTGYIAKAQTEVAAPVERVWDTMTDPDQVAEYMMGARVESDWQQGSAIIWSGEFDGKPYQDRGEVLEVEPGRRLVVTYYSALSGQDDVPDNYHTVRYDLAPAGEGTTVGLAQDGCASAEEAEQFSKNWQTMLNSLKKVAEAP